MADPCTPAAKQAVPTEATSSEKEPLKDVGGYTIQVQHTMDKSLRFELEVLPEDTSLAHTLQIAYCDLSLNAVRWFCACVLDVVGKRGVVLPRQSAGCRHPSNIHLSAVPANAPE
eukprot:5894156-Alexandrium_andersonii.AAC.1